MKGMEMQMEEETTSRLNLIILGVIMVVIIVAVLGVIFSGNTGFVKTIVCGMVSWLPGGSLTSIYLECGIVPV